MGYSGQPIKVIKANRALLKKRSSFSDIRKTYEGYVGDTKLSFKQLTDFEQKKLKDKIRAQARLDKRNEMYLFALSLVGVALIFLLLYWMFV